MILPVAKPWTAPDGTKYCFIQDKRFHSIQIFVENDSKSGWYLHRTASVYYLPDDRLACLGYELPKHIMKAKAIRWESFEFCCVNGTMYDRLHTQYRKESWELDTYTYTSKTAIDAQQYARENAGEEFPE